MKTRKIAVIGLGKFGSRLVEVLSQKGTEVLAIDDNEESISRVQDLATESIRIDLKDKKALEESGVKNVDLVVVAVGGGRLETNILVTALLKQIEVKEIIARATTPTHAQILKALGVSKVVSPEEDMAQRLARSILIPGVKDYLELKGPWHVSEVEIGQGSKFIGKAIKEIQAGAKYHVNILMIERETDEPGEGEEVKAEVVRYLPGEGYIIQEKDILVIFGEAQNIEDFEKACCE